MSIKDHPLVRKESGNVWVRNKIHGINEFPRWKRMQGGTTVESDGYVFLYNDSAERGNTYLCVSKSHQNALCFKITFDDIIREISVDVSYSTGCFINKQMPKSTSTFAMFEASLKLIFSRKNVKIFNCIKLTDNSIINCESLFDKLFYEIQLMNLNFICTGYTWYSSLIPMFLVHKQDESDYYKDKEKILNNSLSWNMFLDKLPADVKTVINTHIEFEDERSRKLPAHVILNKIRKAKVHCILFTKYMSDFFDAFEIHSMYGKDWCIPLRNGRVVACKTDPSGLCCHPEKGWVLNDSLIEWTDQEDYNLMKDNLQVNIPRITYSSSNTVRVFKY